jgi:hypothetical protein
MVKSDHAEMRAAAGAKNIWIGRTTDGEYQILWYSLILIRTQ